MAGKGQLVAIHRKIAREAQRAHQKAATWQTRERAFVDSFVKIPRLVLWCSQKLRWNWPLKRFMKRNKLEVRFSDWKDKARIPRRMEVYRSGELIGSHP